MFESVNYIVAAIDATLDTKRKRHIVGGIFISISLLCGGLAITTMTLMTEENNEESF